MALITRLVLLLAVVAPFAAATFTVQTQKDCSSQEFYFGKKSCCLPRGGPPAAPPPPPKGSDCPPNSHYWSKKTSCCVPRNPPRDNEHEPICWPGWEWKGSLFRCEPEAPTPPKPEPPQPSGHPSGPPSYPGTPGHGPPGPLKNEGNYHKRAMKSRSNLCPAGLDACPSSAKASISEGYECIDAAYDISSCGGCASTGKGTDCSAIKGAWNVGCEQGICAVYTCQAGFKTAESGDACIAL